MNARRLARGGTQALLIWFCLACEAFERSPAGDWAGTIDTLPSGRVQVRSPQEGYWAPDEGLRLTETLRLGVLQGDVAQEFGRITGLEVDPAGRIFVLDGQAQEIRVFGPDGSHVETIGRTGNGPGELLRPYGLEVDVEGSLWVRDLGNSRFAVYGLDRTEVQHYALPEPTYQFPWPGRITREGLLYEYGDLGPAGERIVTYRVNGSLIPIDTFPGPHRGWSRLEREDVVVLEGGVIISVPFGRKNHWGLDGNGNLWTGHSGAYQLFRREAQGDTTLVLERAVEAPAVTTSVRSAAIEGWSQMTRGQEVPDLPTTRPYFQAIIPGPDGELWILRERSGPAWFFDVFGPDGRFAGEVDLPVVPVVPSLAPLPIVSATAVYVVTAGELDVPQVVRLDRERQQQ